MSILGVVGTTELTKTERKVVEEFATEFLDANPDIDLILHLNSTGVEETVVNLGIERGIPNEAIPIYNYTWNGGLTTGVLEGGFKDANIKLVDRCDKILVMTTARDKSGGPLWAAKRARKDHKPVARKTFLAPPEEVTVDGVSS